MRKPNDTERVLNAIKQLKEDLVTFKQEILGEIQDLREEVTIVVGYKDHIEDREVRIEKVEKTIATPR